MLADDVTVVLLADLPGDVQMGSRYRSVLVGRSERAARLLDTMGAAAD